MAIEIMFYSYYMLTSLTGWQITVKKTTLKIIYGSTERYEYNILLSEIAPVFANFKKSKNYRSKIIRVN